MNKAVFLDRDGTIIPETGARVADPDVDLLPEAVDAVKKLRHAGFLVVVVTNQSGVARGYYTEHELNLMHDAILVRFDNAQAPLDGIYYCPHLPDGSVEKYAVACDCRKPKPGLFLRAAKDLDIDLAASYAVGDSERDVAAAANAGCKGTALIVPDFQQTFNIDPGVQPQWQVITEQMEHASETGADAAVPDVATAADWILETERMSHG
jgi:D-glycero-D-manno-heptose 1,7-bisphosphate phosphatase